MCLASINKPYITGKDIVVMKWVEPEFSNGEIIHYRTPYVYYPYYIGKLEKTPIIETRDEMPFDYLDKREIDRIKEYFPNKPIKWYGQGFHSFLPERLLIMGKTYKKWVGICKIPAESTVIEGFTDLLVSNQIVLEKVVTREEALEIAWGRPSEDDLLPSDSLSHLTSD